MKHLPRYIVEDRVAVVVVVARAAVRAVVGVAVRAAAAGAAAGATAQKWEIKKPPQGWL